MRKKVLSFFLFLAAFSLAAIGYSQDGSIDIPSISAEAGHVYIANRTNQEVVFYLESESTERTEHLLGAGMGATYNGEPNDKWFNIQIYSGSEDYKHEASYGIDAGTRHYIAWQNGVLDVFRMPPN